MPISYQIYPELKLVYAKGTGKLHLADVIDHLLCLANDPAYLAPMLKLVDCREMDLEGFSFSEVRRVAAMKEGLLDHFRGERSAFVMNSALGYGIGRQHQSLMGDADLDIGIFRDFNEALRWLAPGVTGEQLISGWNGTVAGAYR